MSRRQRGWIRGIAQTALTGLLCGLMTVPQAAFAAGPPSAARAMPKRAEKQAPLTEQERVLHALNRFTFGPRPGDAADVERMGLDRWFLEQLQPEKIDDSAFEQRMTQFPALRLSQSQLMERFPSQAMLRMTERRDLPMPHDRVQRAILSDAKYEYDLKQKALATEKQTQPEGGMPASMQMAGATTDADMAGNELNKKGKLKGKDLIEPAPEDVQALLAMSPDQRVDRMVSMRPEEMLAFKSALKPMQKLLLLQGMTPQDAEIAESFMTAPERVVGAEVLDERLERDVFSERQLQAVMTDFWLNHFSVYLRKNQNEPYYLPGYERDVILPHAMGKFENLLVAVAQSPAMLMYLDNWESVGPHSDQAERAQYAPMFRPNAKKQAPKGINENYARELMELHTLGVNGGYTQQDVIEVAKCFTGWTIDKPAQGGEAYFDEARHEPGTKIVLGHKIKSKGQKEGLEVLHILATSPATAHFVSEKLAVRFLSDTPPPALVNRMAAAFLKTDGNIRAVLLTMYRSPEFWSPQVYRAKVKTPIEFMASALRASGADVKNPLPLVQAMDRLGMPIYGMQTPQGYSWASDDWVSSNALISRMNFALVLSSNRVMGTRTDWPGLLGDSDGAVLIPDAQTENRLEIALLGEPATDRTRSTVLAQFDDPTAQQSAEEAFKASPSQSDSEMSGRFMQTKAGHTPQQQGTGSPVDTMAGLLLGSPEFQRR
ncbi:MAG TPA: DUF1800 domain-containing protein [Acidobacteriaceae bacterium]|jgi:uncharacterized protein (DUF1800 family)